ncbi:MAG: hypothetical protein WEA54_06455 [Actinomycetota bacterium]
MSTATHAVLWYPLAAVVVTGAIAAWAWSDCGSANDVAACREAVVPGSLLLLTVMLIAGLVILALMWVVLRLLRPMLSSRPTDEESGWAPHGAGWTDERRPGSPDPEGGATTRGGPEPDTDDPRGDQDATSIVVPSRVRRHDQRSRP